MISLAPEFHLLSFMGHFASPQQSSVCHTTQIQREICYLIENVIDTDIVLRQQTSLLVIIYSGQCWSEKKNTEKYSHAWIKQGFLFSLEVYTCGKPAFFIAYLINVFGAKLYV